MKKVCVFPARREAERYRTVKKVIAVGRVALGTLVSTALIAGQAFAQEGGAAAPPAEAAKSMNLIQIFIAGGLVMWPLLAMLVAALYFTFDRFTTYAKDGNEAKGLPEEVSDLVRNGQIDQALQRAQSVPGPVAASMATVLQSRGQSVEDIERNVEVTSENYFLNLEKWLPELDTFTTLSPLLGLLGTILGMVKVFQQFQGASTEEGKKRILEGVGESLYATAFGIGIAVFCFAVYNYFSARQRTVSIKTGQAATRLLAQMHERNLVH
jgi:biopolymer transport protein ExbB